MFAGGASHGAVALDAANGPLEEPAWNPLSAESINASMAVADQNVYRRETRRTAPKFAMAGAIVLFVGGALFVSSRRSPGSAEEGPN